MIRTQRAKPNSWSRWICRTVALVSTFVGLRDQRPRNREVAEPDIIAVVRMVERGMVFISDMNQSL